MKRPRYELWIELFCILPSTKPFSCQLLRNWLCQVIFRGGYEVLRVQPWICMSSLTTTAFHSGMHQMICKVSVGSFFFIEQTVPCHVISSRDVYGHQKIPVAFCTFLHIFNASVLWPLLLSIHGIDPFMPALCPLPWCKPPPSSVRFTAPQPPLCVPQWYPLDPLNHLHNVRVTYKLFEGRGSTCFEHHCISSAQHSVWYITEAKKYFLNMSELMNSFQSTNMSIPPFQWKLFHGYLKDNIRTL